MTKYVIVFLIFLAVTGIVAEAGFVDPTINPDAAPFVCDFANKENSHGWSFNYVDAVLTIDEVIGAVALDDIMMTGETDSDPIFTVVKTVENNSGVDWTGYEFALSGTANAVFVFGTAGAAGGKLEAVSYVDSQTIVFSGSHPVLNGETVTFQVDVQVPTTGLFDFSMSQQPIPEPATMTLLAIGSSLLLRRRQCK